MKSEPQLTLPPCSSPNTSLLELYQHGHDDLKPFSPLLVPEMHCSPQPRMRQASFTERESCIASRQRLPKVAGVTYLRSKWRFLPRTPFFDLFCKLHRQESSDRVTASIADYACLSSFRNSSFERRVSSIIFMSGLC